MASSVPGSTGTPTFCASARAAVLSPIMRSSSTRGPTKVMPASPQAWANSAFSDKKSVAGMDEIHALFLGQRDDAGNVQVRAHGAFALAHHVGLIRLEPVDGQPILRGVDGDGAQSKFSGGAKDADGDLAAVGDEQFSRFIRLSD